MALVRQSLIYMNHFVNKETREALCHILGVMVKKYNHGLGKQSLIFFEYMGMEFFNQTWP